MCDYSLENQVSRAAEIDDRLVTGGFRNSSTRGFHAEGKPDVAICLLPGTELAFDRPVTYQGIWGLLSQAFRQESKTARFRSINVDNPETHHDALELASGRFVLLNYLRPGQRATVLQLPLSRIGESHVHSHEQLFHQSEAAK